MEVFYIFSLSLLFISLTSVADAYRLPRTILPSHYEVHINISESAFTPDNNDFSGTVVIHFDGTTPTTVITLHASYEYISITDITLNNEVIPLQNTFVNATTDILTINYASGIQPGTQYALRIDYIGQLAVTDMSGFYKSSYVDAQGVTQYLATTQFQATHARRAIPSWDEPSFKATFSILITYPSELNVLSNTFGTIRTVSGGRTTIEFDRTPVMSTYLVAFIVSNFTCTTGNNIDHIPYRVCSREEAASSREWAVEIGSQVMAKFDEYTAYNYSSVMPKMDQVAIPDFSAGAMENWGLVTYRETSLLWNPDESSNSYKQSIAGTIAHEFTHSWFGNLVTCDWWSVTFLNEGFARLLQYSILDEVLPDWELKKQFAVVVLQAVLDTDSYLTALPLQSTANTPSEVDGKFGTISYHKGASILRMLENTMTPANFRAGIQNYLRTYAFSSTTPNDLWNALSSSVDQTLSSLPADLPTVMQNWVENSGYPLLTVTTSGSNVIVTQERFLLSGSDTTSKWYVPITFTTSNDSNKFATTTPEGWLTPTSDLTITLPAGNQWVILNNQQAGYFRVNYELSLWDNIARALAAPNFSDIPEVNRAEIVDDVFNLAKIEKVLYSKAFEIVDFLKNDISYFSWYPAFNGFNYLIRRIGQESELGQSIVEHISDLMDNLYRSVPLSTLDESDHIYTLKQVSAVSWACRLGKQDCVTSILEIFRQYRENNISPNKNLKSIVYCNALRYSSSANDWEFLWQQFLTTDVATERSVLISALGCTTNVYLLNTYLLRSINSTSGITPQDAYAVFSAVYEGNSIGVDVAFRFLLQYYQAISDYYQSMNSLANLMNGIAARLTSPDQIYRLETFIQTADLSDAFREAATQSLETAKTNVAWIEQYRDDLHEYYGIEEEPVPEDHDDSIDPIESTLPEYRLSSNFQPTHYEVHLGLPTTVFTASGTNFTGTAVIHFTVRSATNEIKLHSSAENVHILSIQLNNAVIPSESYSVNTTTDILTIQYDNGLEPNTLYILRFQYDGIFGSGNRGFYKSSYLDDEGVRRYLVTTQFQPTHTRRAFPCFDEPQYKATFQILISYPTALGLNARSNTIGSVVQQSAATGLTTIQFGTTPVMSSYLIAFVVSDFTCTQGESVGSAPYQVCSRDNEREHREFAVDVGPKLLASLDEFTGHPYGHTMPKMDQFAIPDFAAGAMENWGIVTYREPYLLWDPQVSTNLLQQSVATVIAHEFAHMWFGNLVTCKWWSETFLNEGFATYFEFFTTHDVLPDWELDKQFVVRVHQPVLQTDSYLTSQPLQSPASSPTQVSNKFGSVTYSKGGSIFRMVEHFMGLENFKAGLQHYLHLNQFSNTKPENLWTALNEYVDNSISRLPVDLESVMENWVKTSGFPLLYVSIVGGNVVISQERFLFSGSDISSRWYVPISYTTSVDQNKFENTLPSGWLTPGSNWTYPTAAEWVILNNRETAFYRVNYAPHLWDGIALALSRQNFSDIPEENRAQIADDLFNLVRIDRVSYSRVLRTIEFLENDISFITWYPVYNELNTLFNRVGLHTFLGNVLRQHVLQLSANLYNSAPVSAINEDNHLYTLKQSLSVNLACRMGNPDCAQHMRDVFAEFRHNGTSPPKNLETLVLCNGVRHSTNRTDWDFLWDRYTTTTSSAERSILVTALGCTTDETLLTLLLSRAIDSESGVVISDSPSIFAAVYAHHTSHNVAFRFVVANYQAMYNYFQNLNTIGSIIQGIVAKFTTQEEIEELQNFMINGGVDSALMPALTSALANALSNWQWVQLYQDDLYDYYGLDPPQPSTTPGPTTPTTPPTTTPDGAATITSSVILTLLLVFVNNYYLN